MSAVVSFSMMTTTTTGLLRGATIELESAVPEMDGQRVRVMLEPVEESDSQPSNSASFGEYGSNGDQKVRLKTGLIPTFRDLTRRHSAGFALKLPTSRRPVLIDAFPDSDLSSSHADSNS